MTVAWLGLGANLGDARSTLRDALAELAALPGTSVVAVSSFYRSAPVDAGGPDYTNAVAKIETQLAPDALLAALQSIETAHGRARPYRNAPRTLDMDILLYGQSRIETPQLTVPHPRMHERAFVLLPLAELDPHIQLEQGSLAQCIQACSAQPIERLADADQSGPD